MARHASQLGRVDRAAVVGRAGGGTGAARRRTSDGRETGRRRRTVDKDAESFEREKQWEQVQGVAGAAEVYYADVDGWCGLTDWGI